MDNLQSSSKNSNNNFGWSLVLLVAILQVISSFALFLGDTAETFEADTGIVWSELVAVFPTGAAQFEMAQQSAIAGSLVIGLMSTAIVLFALRKGEVWAWFTLWLMPLYMLPGTISLAQSDNQAWVAVMAVGFILLVVVGLMISFPFSLRNRKTLPGDQVESKGQAG